MDIAEIRTGLSLALVTLNAEVKDVADLKVLTPAIMIFPTDIPAQATYDGKYDIVMELLLLAGSADMEGGQNTLDAWLSSQGSESISAALVDDPTLGDTVSAATWGGMVPNSYGMMTLQDGGTNYLTARATVNILT